MGVVLFWLPFRVSIINVVLPIQTMLIAIF